MVEDRARPDLVVVCGADRARVLAAAASAGGPGRVVVSHDLAGLAGGVVVRHRDDGRVDVLEVAHADVSGVLHEELVPLLRRLAADPSVRTVVLALEPAMEPAVVCGALSDPASGAPVTDALDVRGVVAVVDGAAWLDDAASDDLLADRGIALGDDDERTVGEVVVGHTEFADVLVVDGPVIDAWAGARRDAVLARLNPAARRARPGEDLVALLADLDPASRRGVPDDPHGPLLRGRPPLSRDAGVALLHVGFRRPFHPGRLHDAVETLLTGTLRIRGRIWLATQPDHVLWVASAGGALELRSVGRWLVADPEGWSGADPERSVSAALRWDERWGDREQNLVMITDGAGAADLVEVLDAALLTDDELAAGEDAWRRWDDPLGLRHADPCDELADRAPQDRGAAASDHPRGAP